MTTSKLCQEVLLMEPLLTNDRAVREWAWLCQRVGEGAARAAIARLPGQRKPFPLNIARVLGLRLPPPEQLPPVPAPAVPPSPEVLQRLRELRAKFAR